MNWYCIFKRFRNKYYGIKILEVFNKNKKLVIIIKKSYSLTKEIGLLVYVGVFY